MLRFCTSRCFRRKDSFPQFTNRPYLTIELLEARTLLSGSPPIDAAIAHPGAMVPAVTNPAPFGLTPAQVRRAYGFDQVNFGNGSGQTIAIVDAYDDPNIAADLAAFDAQFHLPAPPRFAKVNQSGGRSLPAADAGWSLEIALDVEWAHAIAPGAAILLVEADSSYDSDLMAAVDYARHQPGVVAVSMSWGGGESSGEQTWDSTFTTPAGHVGGSGLVGGITFVGASGDNGAPASWPTTSPNVLAVGGTALNVDTYGNYLSETGWANSGGGVSQFQTTPAYQAGLPLAGARGNPDVAYDADPTTGFAVYNTVADSAGRTGWTQVGGTSAGAPQWAALVALADQGRARQGMGSLDGVRETLPILYALPATSFHDITAGNNGIAAVAGYDLVTGRGTPTASLIGYLASSPITANQKFIAQVYHELLGRPADPSGLLSYGSQLDQGGSRNWVVLQIESSAEYRARLVQTVYQGLLGRPADGIGLTFFVGWLGSGGTLEQVKAAVLGSVEYFQAHGGTSDNFLAALYHDALGRAVDAGGLAWGQQALASGTSRAMLAQAVFGSSEYQQELVQDLFRQYLHRAADGSGLGQYTRALQAGFTDQQIIAALLSSDEYFARL